MKCNTSRSADNDNNTLPLVINTWPFTVATDKAWEVLTEDGGSPLDALEKGCNECEERKCADSIGYGGHPDEKGETTLDAMVMDGITHTIGAVASLRRVKYAISVARYVMEYTKHTMLAGDQATDFATEMGFTEESLSTNESTTTWEEWKDGNCQPNFRQNVVPDPTTSCGPYKPINDSEAVSSTDRRSTLIGPDNHDTIGMIIIDSDHYIVGGTTTNGAQFRVPGRVGDSPIPGSGAYCDKDVGGAAGTGDGDVMMRFLPSYQAVESMRSGMTPTQAAEDAIRRIIPYFPTFSGALVTTNIKGEYGAACYGMANFQYTIRNPSVANSTILTIACLPPPTVIHQN